MIWVPGSITKEGLAVPGFSQWGVSCGKGSLAVANGGGRAAHSLANGEGGTWERVTASSFPVWPVGGERGGRGDGRRGNREDCGPGTSCARALFTYVRVDALSYDPGLREPRITCRAVVGRVCVGASWLSGGHPARFLLSMG